MVIIDIVINTLLGRVIRHPAGMHCLGLEIAPQNVTTDYSLCSKTGQYSEHKS